MTNSLQQTPADHALDARLPSLPAGAHVREVLVREGWLATTWLRTVLLAKVAPEGERPTFARLAQAVQAGAAFELAVEHATHLDFGPDADRVRVGQELLWGCRTLVSGGVATAPRVLWMDLLERSENMFGDKFHGPVEVATPSIEPPMSPQDQNALVNLFIVLFALATALAAGALAWKSATLGFVALWSLGAGSATALGLRLLLPFAKVPKPPVTPPLVD